MTWLDQAIAIQGVYERRGDARLPIINEAVSHFVEARGFRQTAYRVKGAAYLLANAAKEHRLGVIAFKKAREEMNK